MLKKKKTIKCHKCGHVWVYKGNMRYATCPDCYFKVNTEKHEVNEDVSDD